MRIKKSMRAWFIPRHTVS
ncbi:rCG53009 [Rattus norvegicus]|uniref:RCG53009 n=1 Tax=Rattus norvegicus TaxID=10116 RepID=A6IR41_RAT|nr:rCG53009 [Rattus norvegicus]